MMKFKNKADKLQKIIDLKSTLNTDQAIAFDQIVRFIDDNPDEKEAHVLKGYAGTGKTYLVGKIIEYLKWKNKNVEIAGTAPTNKAVKVLKSSAKHGSVDYMTVHKLLGLRQQINNDGTVTFKPDKEGKYDIADYDYLIVDEVSMLDDELCECILRDKHHAKVIFMGDPAQIPPVGSRDSIPFLPAHSHRFGYSELEEVMRQKGSHPVLDASMTIRENLKEEDPVGDILTTINKDSGNGIVRLRVGRDKDKMAKMIQSYFLSTNFEKNSDYVKIIAWTNKTVDTLNDFVRKCLFGRTPDRFMPGEKLVVNTPIYKSTVKKWKSKSYNSYEMKLNTSDEIEVKECSTIIETINIGREEVTVKFWKLKTNRTSLKIVHEDDMHKWKAFLGKLKAIAIRQGNSAYWIDYYDAIKCSHDVAYNYAITAHKSQGSTYDNVFLIEDDVDKNSKKVERNRIKYTAYTRTKDKLFIYKS